MYPVAGLLLVFKKPIGALIVPGVSLLNLLYENGLSLFPLVGWAVVSSLWLAFFLRMKKVLQPTITQAPASSGSPQP